MKSPTLLSQRDPRWKLKKLGTSNVTIGGYGCTITALTSLARLDDVSQVNDILKANNGYAEGNLVIWDKVSTIPNLHFNYRYYQYDNAKVKQIIATDGACLVEVDGAPIGGYRHWLLYIGNQQLIDPWDGVIKNTSSYKPISFVDISYKELLMPDSIDKDLVTDANNWRYLRQKYDISDPKQIDDKVKNLENELYACGELNKQKESKIKAYEDEIKRADLTADELSIDLNKCDTTLVKTKASAAAIEDKLKTDITVKDEEIKNLKAELEKSDDSCPERDLLVTAKKEKDAAVKKYELLKNRPLKNFTQKELIAELFRQWFK